MKGAARRSVAAITRSRSVILLRDQVIAATASVAALVLVLTPCRASDAEYNLTDFGPAKTTAEVQATLQAAITNIIARGGGILVVGPGTNPDWIIENHAPSSTLRGTNTVTIVDRRNGCESVLLPSNGKALGTTWTGVHLARTVRQPIDMAFGVHSTQAIDTSIAGGTASYDQPSLSETKAGDSQRVYVPTIRGLAPGLSLVIRDASRDAGEPVDRVVVKELGWDREKKQSCFVADLKRDHPKGALVGNKHTVTSLSLTDHSQSDNQSMGLMVARKNYGLGDSFVISASARSMGNGMSGLGDEGGFCFAADISNDLRPFRGQVESINWKTSELVYAPGATRNHTLGTSRPIINLNTNKWIRRGEVYFVGCNCPDPWQPDRIVEGGGIIGSKECGWTDEIVGRFFAFDEPSEYLDPQKDRDVGCTAAPDQRTHRWYRIDKLADHKDGARRIWLERVRWNVQCWVPLLYDNTWTSNVPDAGQSRLKPMRYIIAPGAYVADVSRAWTDAEAGGGHVSAASPRTLKLAPSPDAGGKFDFAKGDPIVQAIGPDPWNVTGLRVRHHNYLPSTLPDSSLQAVNYGRVAVGSALSVRGVWFGKAIDIAAVVDTGIRFRADVGAAAIVFEPPHDRPQPIWWYANDRPAAGLSVDPKNGDFSLRGGPARVNGVAMEGQGGISGSETPARNLRGIAVAIREGSAETQVHFERPEADALYALAVQPNWATAAAVVEKTAESFVVEFDRPAPRNAQIDWLLVR